MADQLAEGQAQELIQKAIELAKTGNVSCMHMVLDRVWPIRKGRPVNLEVGPIRGPKDVLAAIAMVWTAIGEGRLTPEEASALFPVIEKSMQAIELHEVRNRVEELEDQHEE
jgi:hypothetical protein